MDISLNYSTIYAFLLKQAASLACAVRLANATRSMGIALRASQRTAFATAGLSRPSGSSFTYKYLQFIGLKFKFKLYWSKLLVKIIPV